MKGNFAGADRVSRQLKQTFPGQSIGYTFNLNSLVTQLSWDEQQSALDREILDDAEKTLSIFKSPIAAVSED